MIFDKEDYWFNRKSTDKEGNPTPKRGQGDEPELSRTIYPTIIKVREGAKMVLRQTKPADMGIKKFKNKHSTRFTGHYNPKKKSIRGAVLRDLKTESWAEMERRVRPITGEEAKAKLGAKK